jgi:hypothetical protein
MVQRGHDLEFINHAFKVSLNILPQGADVGLIEFVDQQLFVFEENLRRKV